MSRLISHEKPWFFLSSLTRTSEATKTQTITRTSTGGTVTFSVNGETTGTVPATSGGLTAAAVQAALRALESIDVSDVTVTGSDGGPLTVTGNIGNLTPNNGSATGGTVSVAAGAAASEGDDFIVPIGSLVDAADITEAIRAFGGWAFEGQDVDVPDFSSRFPKTIPGVYGKATPSLDIYRNDDPASRDAEVEALLVEGADGFVVRSLNGAPEIGAEVQVWPVTVKSAVAVGDSEATTGKEQTTKVMFSVTDAPQLHVTVTA